MSVSNQHISLESWEQLVPARWVQSQIEFSKVYCYTDFQEEEKKYYLYSLSDVLILPVIPTKHFIQYTVTHYNSKNGVMGFHRNS